MPWWILGKDQVRVAGQRQSCHRICFCSLTRRGDTVRPSAFPLSKADGPSQFLRVRWRHSGHSAQWLLAPPPVFMGAGNHSPQVLLVHHRGAQKRGSKIGLQKAPLGAGKPASRCWPPSHFVATRGTKCQFTIGHPSSWAPAITFHSI
jgi:hypothetical protein